MTYEPFIVSSADVQMTLTKGTNSFSIATGIQLSVSMTQDVNEIFAIGQQTPIGIKSLNQRFSANLSLQTGEYETILDALNAGATGNFLASILDLHSFSIGWTLNMYGLVTPKTIIYSLDSCSVNNQDLSFDRNTPETSTAISLQGIGITRNVKNL